MPWRECAGLADGERLACYDRWAAQQVQDPAKKSESNQAPAPAEQAQAAIITVAYPVANEAAPPVDNADITREEACRDRQYSTLSRFWELERGSDCGTFGIRGYRPISLSVIVSDGVNRAPSSPSPGHTASAVDYQKLETRIQLSVRTKIAQGLLTPRDAEQRDSLWFGYTQQSYWQLFNGGISRPFRTTDHEPEAIYVYPSTADLPGGWRLRYSGLGLVHQSNGQSLPLSRSWNRAYLMAGLENGRGWQLLGRVWKRAQEKTEDDNPDIVQHVGRAELLALWSLNQRHSLGATWRSALEAKGKGSLRLDWLRTLGNPYTSTLRLHTQLFTGYGDSLLDYNRRRMVLSVGLSLVDF
jgi:phospholipase A1/A2